MVVQLSLPSRACLLVGVDGRKGRGKRCRPRQSFEEAKIDRPLVAPQAIERFEIGATPDEPTELNTDTLELEKPGQIGVEGGRIEVPGATSGEGTAAAGLSEPGGGVGIAGAQPNLGGLGGFDIKSLTAGPAVHRQRGRRGRRGQRNASRRRRRRIWICRPRRGQPSSIVGERRWNAPVGAGRGRCVELALAASGSRRQLESHDVQNPLQRRFMHRRGAGLAGTRPRRRHWRCCRFSARGRRMSRRASTSERFKRGSPT